jgi:hypothetical protein
MVAKDVAQYVQINKVLGSVGPTATKNKRIMNISLNIDGKYTNIFNIYALAEGKSKANLWMYKKLHPVLEESRAQGWLAVVGGDFNQKAGPLDGRPDRARPFTVNPGLSSLLTGDHKLINSFWHIHGNV